MCVILPTNSKTLPWNTSCPARCREFVATTLLHSCPKNFWFVLSFFCFQCFSAFTEWYLFASELLLLALETLESPGFGLHCTWIYCKSSHMPLDWQMLRMYLTTRSWIQYIRCLLHLTFTAWITWKIMNFAVLLWEIKALPIEPQFWRNLE